METLLHAKLLLSAEVESLKSGSFDQTYVKKAEHIISGESYQLVQQFVDKFKEKLVFREKYPHLVLLLL